MRSAHDHRREQRRRQPADVAASGTGTATAPTTIELIEYYHAEWDHYFMTGIADEITKLDNGTFVGWARTGLSFKAYPIGDAERRDRVPVLQHAFDPRSSHFYTPFADECAIVKTNPDWPFEGEVFSMPGARHRRACARPARCRSIASTTTARARRRTTATRTTSRCARR